ncbi:MAG: Uma2 family endonuclease [Chloroflexi bacterium]|nr:Uma2 family endonuclease [Chloroflexota bacterium]
MSQEIITIIGEPVIYEIPRPDISHLVTEDDTPVDNLFSEKQMRLLADSLYNGWSGPSDGRPFLATTDVALYYALHTPALVPDLLLSLGVTPPTDPKPKENRSYLVWEYGKAPDLVVEIVSNRKGGELGNKLLDYARAGVSYYVVFDPFQELGEEKLRIFSRRGGSFREIAERWLAEVELGLILWEGTYEDWSNTLWLRWVDREGNLIPTGAEATAQASRRAEEASQRAEEAERQAREERRQREELLAKLRAQGIDPDKLSS